MFVVRRAVGVLRQQRAASVTLIAVLGLTMGVAGAALDVTAAYLWRPLPYPFADRLAVVDLPRARGAGPREMERVDWSGVRAFADLVVSADVDSFTVTGAATPFAVDGRWISADVFEAFGIVPAAGRFFTRDEAVRGDPVAVIGYDVWQEHYAGRASVVGESATVRATLRQGEAQRVTIVGVLPPRFWHLEQRTGLLLPQQSLHAPLAVRLADGVTADAAAARLTALARAALPAVPPDWSVQVRDARDAHVSRLRPMLSAGAVALLLLAAAAGASLAFLQLARGVSRQREVAIRSVLGATSRDLTAQILGEGVAIGVAASAVAIVTTIAIGRVGASLVERTLGRLLPGGAAALGSDVVLIVAIAGATLAAAVLLGIILLAASRSAGLASALAGHASATDSPPRVLARHAIAGAQVAVAFCLLLAAALMIRTSWHLSQIDLGFEPRGVFSANVAIHESAYRSVDQRQQFYAALIDRLQRMPGVAHVGLTDWLPFRVGPAFGIEPDGQPGLSMSGSIQGVSPGYFDALQMRVLDGRTFTDADRARSLRVAVVSRDAARALWRDANPIGRTFRIRFSAADPGRPGFGPFTVVGIVDDSLRSLTAATPPQIYLPFAQQPLATNAFLHLKTSRAPLSLAPEVARAVAEADPSLAIAQVTSLDALVAEEGVRPRLLARVLTALALVGSLIAAIGLYAVSVWMAQQRQREAALRVALGAARGAVTWLLVRRAGMVVFGGLAIGWWLAAPLSRLMAGELHGIAAHDLPTRLAVAALLATISSAALVRPAWSASSANLADLLRREA